MLRNKKGAIEMSMTTIIVIVLGVTMLILGLAFVRNIFTKIGGISDETFDAAQEQLGGLEKVDKLLTINPSRFELKQGKHKAVKIIIANMGEDAMNVKAVASVVGGDKNLECVFAETKSSNSDPHPIKSGGQVQLSLVAKDNEGGLRQTICKVVVEGAPAGEDNRGTMIIDVIA